MRTPDDPGTPGAEEAPSLTVTFALPDWWENDLFNRNCWAYRAEFDLNAYWLLDAEYATRSSWS